jgi:outer membrane biosynthesis protein TonB
MSRWSLRVEQAEVSRLAWAFALSLAFHLLVFGCYHTGNKYHLWQHLHWPAWLQPPKFLTELIVPKRPPPPPPPKPDLPLMFVNVSPAQATTEAPKDAKFYSDKNSRAANPDADKITDIPKIDGKHPEFLKTEDVEHPKFTPLQPSPPPQQPKETKPPPPEPPKDKQPPPPQPPKDKQPPPPEPPKEKQPPPPEPPKEAQVAAKPKPAYTPGDLTLAKPSPTPRTTEGDASEPKPERPRTIRQALAQMQPNQLAGEKMLQDGGVRRHAEIASLDTKATPFGAYDAALVEAISQRWFTLLDQRDYASDSRGKVVLQFVLHYDGRVTGMDMAENSVGDVLGLICQKAVLDPAPFAVWPSDMRRTLGDVRHIRFTFYYY